jgi:ClpP class serine protease
VLDSRTLALAGALGRPLALAASSLGRSYPTFPAALIDSATAARAGDVSSDGETGLGVAGGIAVVQVMGALAQRGQVWECGVTDGYDWITLRFAAALEAGDAVVLVIDSPGGDGAGLAEAVRRMRSLADAAGKPVLAYVDEFAASAAYWIAAGVADEIYLPSSGMVGSIGAIAVHADESAAAESDGVRYTIIRDPDGKAAGTPLEPLGDVGRARIERAVSALADSFVAAMAARRGVSASKLRALDADMLMGAAAVKAGLADGVATLEDVISRAAAAAAERENQMKLKDAVGQLLRMPASASDDEMAASVQAAAPLLDLGRIALAHAGTGDAVAATAQLSAWKSAFDRELAGAPARQAAEDARRLGAIRALAAKLGAASVKADTGREHSLQNVREPWAGMSTEQLEAAVALPTPAVSVATPDPSHASAASAGAVDTLTSEELEVCRQLGQEPGAYLAHKRGLAARSN